MALGMLQGFGVTNTNGPLSVEVAEESQATQVKQLQVLSKSQQRQILEHQEALARLHAMIRETQQAQVGVGPPKEPVSSFALAASSPFLQCRCLRAPHLSREHGRGCRTLCR